MSSEHAYFRLRLPPQLHARISDAATTNHRSINAEIVSRLERTFAAHAGGGADAALEIPSESLERANQLRIEALDDEIREKLQGVDAATRAMQDAKERYDAGIKQMSALQKKLEELEALAGQKLVVPPAKDADTKKAE